MCRIEEAVKLAIVTCKIAEEGAMKMHNTRRKGPAEEGSHDSTLQLGIFHNLPLHITQLSYISAGIGRDGCDYAWATSNYALTKRE
jgi:hypothetical protein